MESGFAEKFLEIWHILVVDLAMLYFDQVKK